MIRSKAVYLVRPDGVRDVVVERESRADGAEGDRVDEVVNAWLAGELDPLEIVKQCHADIPARETLKHTVKVDPKTRKRLHSTRPVPLELRHVIVAKIRDKSPDGSDYNLDGSRWVPRLALILDDGSRVLLPWSPAPEKKEPAGEGATTKTTKKKASKKRSSRR